MQHIKIGDQPLQLHASVARNGDSPEIPSSATESNPLALRK